MAGIGASGVASGGAALYGGSRMLAPGVDYGAAMSRVQALTRLNGDDPLMQALRDQARQLGANTSFSATQAADAQGFLAMAGFDPEAIIAAMPDMLDLAKANGTDLGRTADISSNILSGFGLDPSQMGHVGDVLTATTTRANVDLEKLGESMKYVAPQARAMGVSIEEAAAMAGLLGNVGIQGSQAGTTLRAMITRLSAPTGAAAGALQELGVNAKDAEGNLRNVPQILADVAQATERLGTADRAAYLKDIFGEEPGAGMAELIAQQGAAGVEKFVEILESAAGENARVAKTMADNIQGDLQGLNSAWQEVGITVTDTNEGPLRQLIQNLTGVTRAVGSWMKENPRLTGTLTTVAAVLAVVVAAGGALTMMLASVLGPIALLRYGFALLAINGGGLIGTLLRLAGAAIPAVLAAVKGMAVFLATNPIGLAVAAIAAAVFLIIKYWEPISGFFRNLWNGVTELFGNAWQAIQEAFAGGIAGVSRLLLDWSPMGILWRGITEGLQSMGVEIPERFTTLGNAMVDGLMAGIDAKWQALKDKVGSLTDGVTGWFREALGINSPSRVFAEYGGYTVDGFNVGLDRQRDEPAKRVRDIARRVATAGAGIAIGTAGLPAVADIPIDRRPALSAPAPVAPAAGDTITINVYGAPGGDAREIARAISLELDRREAHKAARRRSALWDLE
nr:phage tail tape measure protein [Halomonas sp. MCCC 1A17488]